nr:hypothetical protein [Tanacetum cinerariifolium]
SQGASFLWGSSGVSSGSVVEVVEWSRVEERVVLWGWREKRVQLLQSKLSTSASGSQP